MHAVHLAQHPVLVEAPFRELGEVIEDRLRVGVEDVRAVLVHQDAGFVVAIVGVAADMVAPVDHENPLVALAREAFCQNAACEAGADDQPVIHGWCLQELWTRDKESAGR
jgi:hypothetical protein